MRRLKEPFQKRLVKMPPACLGLGLGFGFGFGFGLELGVGFGLGLGLGLLTGATAELLSSERGSSG